MIFFLRKNQIDHALCKFFFGCNIALDTVQSKFFIEFVRCLEPEYRPPTRKTLSNSFLNMFYDWVISKIKEEHLQDGVALMDGWKNEPANTKNDVVSTVRTTSGNKAFLEAWNFSRIRETGEALSVFANHCKNVGIERYFKNFFRIVY